MKIKIAYLTASFPYGNGESFILPEILFLLQKQNNIIIFPLLKRGNNNLNEIGIRLILKSGKLFFLPTPFSFFLFIKNLPFIIRVLVESYKSSFIHLLKNILIIPKSIYIARQISKNKIDHLHVHWGATTATCGMLAAHFSKIKWSFTCHRWDIYENNILRFKSNDALFTRFISKKGLSDGIILGCNPTKSFLLNMGVDIPEELHQIQDINFSTEISIICSASLIEVKGHIFLFQAMKILVNKNFKIKLILCGDGNLREYLINYAKKLSLDNCIFFYGHLSHSELINLYKNNLFHFSILASIDLGNGLHEGVPVSLMEAMSFGIVPISTITGSISELIPVELLVKDKDAVSIANLITYFIENPQIYINKRKEMATLISNYWNSDMSNSKLYQMFLNNEE